MVRSTFDPLAFNFLFCFLFKRVDCQAEQTTTSWHPDDTNIQNAKLADWLRNPISGDLEEVPGIGPANKGHLTAGEQISFIKIKLEMTNF